MDVTSGYAMLLCNELVLLLNMLCSLWQDANKCISYNITHNKLLCGIKIAFFHFYGHRAVECNIKQSIFISFHYDLFFPLMMLKIFLY